MEKALILAAGMGSRLANAHDKPKPLTDLQGEASIMRLFRQFSEAGISKVAVVVGYRGDEIIDFVEKNYQGSLEITWFENHRYQEPNGISVLAAKEFVDQRVMLSMADHLFAGSPVKQMASLPVASKETCLLIDPDIEGVFDLDDATKVKVDDSGNVIDIGKEIENYNAIDTGLFVISPALLEVMESLDSPSLSIGVKALSKKNLMRTVELESGLWQDIDTPEALENALKIISSQSQN